MKRHFFNNTIYNDAQLSIDHYAPQNILDRLYASKCVLETSGVDWRNMIEIPGTWNQKIDKYHLSEEVDIYIKPAFSPQYDQLLGNVISEVNYITSKSQRVKDINERLRKNRRKLKKNFSYNLLQEIQNLIVELYELVSDIYDKQKRYVKRLRIQLQGLLIRDIRNLYRHTVHNIFKNLPDFSGSEEEAAFAFSKLCKPIFFTESQRRCTIQNFYSDPWMHSLHPPNINYRQPN